MAKTFSKKELLDFKNQIKQAIFPQVKDKTKVPEANIGANIAICDRLNAHPVLGWRAERTLHKLTLDKNPAYSILAMIMIDMIVKNCPKFRPYVNTKIFSKDIVKSLPLQIRNPQGASHYEMSDEPTPAETERTSKALLLIQSWASILPHWTAVYEDLKKKNCDFPLALKDEVSPLDYDDTKVAAKVVPKKESKKSFSDPLAAQAESLCEVITDMLKSAHEPTKDPIVKELKASCEACQSKLQQRLASESNQTAVNELIKANEQFLHVNKLYKDVLEGKYVAAKEDAKTDVKQSTQAAQPTQPSQPTQKTTDLLGMASLNLGKGDLNDGINSQASPAPNREKSPDLLDQVFGNAPVVQKQTSAFDDDAFMALAKKRG